MARKLRKRISPAEPHILLMRDCLAGSEAVWAEQAVAGELQRLDESLNSGESPQGRSAKGQAGGGCGKAATMTLSWLTEKLNMGRRDWEFFCANPNETKNM